MNDNLEAAMNTEEIAVRNVDEAIRVALEKAVRVALVEAKAGQCWECVPHLARIMENAVRQEREECARLAEAFSVEVVADAIRRRGE